MYGSRRSEVYDVLNSRRPVIGNWFVKSTMMTQSDTSISTERQGLDSRSENSTLLKVFILRATTKMRSGTEERVSC